MWCCGKDIKDQRKRDDKYRKSVFDQKQVNSLKRKFDYVRGDKAYIDRQTFKKNIGFLGIRSVSGFLDRIFNSFDIDGDNKISFDDFFQYMEILKDGNDDEKAMISFNLIYLEENMDQQRSNRRNSISKLSQTKINQINKKERRRDQKRIDLQMFSRFFQDFFKSWSNITNLAIPKQTRNSLNHFIYQLFVKVQKTGKNYITLEYYKTLYKDKQFMSAFELINSKLGNFFINSASESKKNISVMHKVLKKINQIHQKCFPLNNKEFISQYKKDDYLFYDSMKYTTQSPFTKQEKRFTDFTNAKSANMNFQNSKYNQKFATMQFEQFRNLKQELEKDRNMYKQQHYQKKLQQHVIFLEQKLLYVQSKLEEIIEETKDVYEQMHRQFIKILQSFQKQKLQIQDLALIRTEKNKTDKKVFFGHQNFNLVLQIMVGIQMSVRSVNGYQEMVFEEPQDFQLKHIFQMDSGRFGQDEVFYTFTDYAPNVFNHIRKIYQIENQDYINSIGPNKLMSSLIMGRMASFQQLVSEGKSGSFFYHSQDGKYLIKTIPQRQFYFMRKLLQSYYKYLKSNPKTLIPKFYGLHKISTTVKQTFAVKRVHYMVVMNNIFNTKDQFVEKYDLKGSWVGRTSKDKGGVKKDNDFLHADRFLNIDYQTKVQLMKIIEKDANFFQENDIIDYSLLLGITKPKKYMLNKRNSMRDAQISHTKLFISTASQKEQKDKPYHLKAQDFEETYLIGIIDILTEYSTRKKAENCFKSCAYDGDGISAVPPQNYKIRFLDFMRTKVFRINNQNQSKLKAENHKNKTERQKSKIRKNSSLSQINIPNYEL